MSIPKLEFPPFHLPDEAEALRGEVRAFLKETLPRFKTEDRFASWNTFSPEFSKALLAQADILLKRKTDCTEIIPVLNEAETQADSLQGKQSARQLLQSCTGR